MAASAGGGAAWSPGRSGAGLPSVEPARVRRPLGSRMEVLRLWPRWGGWDGVTLSSRRRVWSPGVLGGRRSCQRRPREMRRRPRRNGEPRPSAIAASGAASSFDGPAPSPASGPLACPGPARSHGSSPWALALGVWEAEGAQCR